MPKRTDISKILILGSGPIIIGQSAEFDYSGTQACKALKAEGFEVVLANSNPATIMTDPEVADRTYIEPLTREYLEEIIRIERQMSPSKGFAVLPKRWIIERTIAWLNRCRRLPKDWENLNRKALAFLRLASIRFMLRKLCNPI